MHSATAYSLLAAALGANARSILSSRGSQCCSFTLSVNGKPVYNNPTDAHQVAYGGSQPGSSTEFCIDSQGQITDPAGICGITQNTGNPSGTTQFQCDANMSMPARPRLRYRSSRLLTRNLQCRTSPSTAQATSSTTAALHSTDA